jgi:GH24 family phage-related lysozyme (muramidase)
MAAGVPRCGIELIKEFEGYHEELPDGRARAYPDPLAGWKVPTIGYGTTRYPDGSPVKQGDVITREEAEQYLAREVEDRCRPALEKIPSWDRMNDNQRGALYSFAYNLGPCFHGRKNFKSITAVCDSSDRWPDKAWVRSRFVKYRNPGSSAEKGLRRRREAEAELFCTPV